MFSTAKVLKATKFVTWSVLGGVIVAGFFVAAFFPNYSVVRFGDPGTVILFLPLFTAFILGVLLVDFELVHAVLAALLTTGTAVGLIVGFMYAPSLAGVAAGPPPYQGSFSAVILFPLILMGTVVGRAIGERIVPPEGSRMRQEALEAETREWHERLTKMEKSAPLQREKGR